MLRARGYALAAVLLIGVAGCGDKKHPQSLHGTWKMTDISGGSFGRMPEATRRQIVGMSKLAITMDPDGKLTTASASAPLGGAAGGTNTVHGTWEVDDKQQLKFTGGNMGASGKTAKGSTPSSTVPFKVSGDGKTLTLTQGGMSMVMTKQ